MSQVLNVPKSDAGFRHNKEYSDKLKEDRKKAKTQ